MASALISLSESLDIPTPAGAENVIRLTLASNQTLQSTTSSAVQLQKDPNNGIPGDDMDITINVVNVESAVTASTSTDRITLTAHGMTAGNVGVLGGTTVPSPLIAGVPYYLRDVTANDFKLALLKNGTAIDLTTTGTAVTFRQLSAPSTSSAYQDPGLPIVVLGGGGVVDFGVTRLMHVTLCARDDTANAKASICVKVGDSTADFSFVSVPLVLNFTAGDDIKWPSALIQIPAGVAFTADDPLRVKMLAGAANVNARIIVQILGK